MIIEYNNAVLVHKRGAKDIWENLYEFVLIENDKILPLENIKKLPAVKKIFGKTSFEVMQISKPYRQLLTHQTIHGQFIKIKVAAPLPIAGYEAVSQKRLDKLPFPKFITGYLKDKNVSLNLL